MPQPELPDFSDPSDAVRAFASSPYKIAMADKLVRMGGQVVPFLEEILRSPLDAETARHTAAILLNLGSRQGVSLLLRELQEGPDAIFCATQLAKAGVREAREPIEQLLAGDLIVTRPFEAMALIDSLRKLGPISHDLKQHLIADCPPQLRQGLQRYLAR
jgi:hypothetical protein